jgi:hypothetical protein
MIVLFNSLSFLNVVLQLTLIAFLLRGHVRRYGTLLTYCLIQLAMNAFQYVAYYTAGVRSALYRNVYWSSEVVAYLLLFIMVILMTDRVLQGSAMRPQAARILLVITIAATALPFVLYHPYFTSRWYRHACQLLSLSGALMNLILWGAMIGKRDRDPQLMKVSAGLGIAVTGVAISYGLFQFVSAEWTWVTDLFKSATLLAMLGVWCWAFRPTHQAASPSGQSLAGTTQTH